MMLADDSIAIEVTCIGASTEKGKFSSKIGDNYIYRLRYKFVFQIYVLDDSVREIWDNLQNGQDENLKFLFEELKEQEIFSYIILGFKVKGEQIFKVFG